MTDRHSLNQQLFQAAGEGDVAALRLALAAGADAKSNNFAALRWAGSRGHAECLKLLIPLSDSKAENSYVLRSASSQGHAECVKLLIPVSDPKAGDSAALRKAAARGRAECVKLLIPLSEPKVHFSLALKLAAEGGHADCVKLLIPVSDPSDLDGIAENARSNGQSHVAAMIDAFVQARALSQSLPAAQPSRSKIAL